MQIIYKVSNDYDFQIYNVYSNGRKKSSTISYHCTKAQRIEIDLLFDFYRELYKKEEKDFYQAFLQKHQLFGTNPNPEPSDISIEEMMKIERLKSAMDNASPIKRITEKSSKKKLKKKT